MALSTNQVKLVGNIGMQAMAFGMQNDKVDADVAIMSALKADLHGASAHRRQPGPKCYETLSKWKEIIENHIGKIDADIADTAPSQQKKLRDRREDMSLMLTKVDVAMEGLSEFAPEPEEVEEESSFVPAEEEKAPKGKQKVQEEDKSKKAEKEAPSDDADPNGGDEAAEDDEGF